MKNFFAAISLVVGVVTSAAMSACVLYVDDSGSSPSSGSNSYCDSSGCYTCDTAGTCKCVDDSCTSTGSGSGSAFSCTTDSQCAQGCYCDSATSTCAESGFCTMDSDCSGGLMCDVSRNTCNQTGSAPMACQSDKDCASGETCDAASGQCKGQSMCKSDAECGVGFTCQDGSCAPAACNGNDSCTPGSMCPTAGKSCMNTCMCTTDAQAQAGGYDYCDETRDTCMKGTNPDPGSCNGNASTAATPMCPPDEVPLTRDGAYTGACEPISACDVAPPCAVLNTEADCLAQPGMCEPTYNGSDCTKADGAACMAGDTDCSCASFTYNSCTATQNPVNPGGPVVGGVNGGSSGGTNGVTGSGPAAGGNGTEPPLGAPALVTIVELPVGSALCPDGGVEQLTGQDNGAGGGIAGDGILEPGEVTSSELNCNT